MVQEHNYQMQLCSINLKQFIVLNQGPKIWNFLPVSFTSLSNLVSFKTKMQEFLLSINKHSIGKAAHSQNF